MSTASPITELEPVSVVGRTTLRALPPPPSLGPGTCEVADHIGFRVLNDCFGVGEDSFDIIWHRVGFIFHRWAREGPGDERPVNHRQFEKLARLDGEVLAGSGSLNVIRVDRRTFLKVRGKGSHERLVPVSPTLVRRIERHLRGRPADTGSPKLFLGIRCGPHGDFEALTPSGVLTLVNSAGERAGIKKRVHPHLFRHSFATEALRRGMNAVQLARVLGHNSLRMIERTHSHLNAGDAYDAVIRMLAVEGQHGR